MESTLRLVPLAGRTYRYHEPVSGRRASRASAGPAATTAGRRAPASSAAAAVNAYTHFVSLPLATPAIREAAAALQARVLAAGGVEEAARVRVERLHVTVCMLRLESEEKIEEACRVLEETQGKLVGFLDGKPLKLRLGPLGTFPEGSTSSTRVIYAQVSDADVQGRLLRFCQLLIDELLARRITSTRSLRDQKIIRDDLTMAPTFHMTLFNARYGTGSPLDIAGLQEMPETEAELGQYVYVD